MFPILEFDKLVPFSAIAKNTLHANNLKKVKLIIIVHEISYDHFRYDDIK